MNCKAEPIDKCLQLFWNEASQESAAAAGVFLHPETKYLREVQEEFLASPDAYQGWVHAVGKERVMIAKNLDQMKRSLAQVRSLWNSGAIGAFVAAEAMQIVVNDLTIMEEMELYVEPIRDLLYKRLAREACDLVERLAKNTVRECLAKLPQVSIDSAEVRRLKKVVSDETQHEIVRNWEPGDEPMLLVITAGRGTRLRTTIPKALLPINGKSFLHGILNSAENAGITRALLVLRYGAQLHQPVFGDSHCYVTQEEALGTGHSAAVGLHYLAGQTGPIVLSYSDTPFLTPQSFESVVAPVREGSADFVMLTVSAIHQPEFGRVCFERGRITAIKQPRFGELGSETADAGLYGTTLAKTQEALLRTTNHNQRYEYSLTRVVEEMSSNGDQLAAVDVDNPIEVLGVNRPADYILARMKSQQANTSMSSEDRLQHELDYYRQYHSLKPSQSCRLRNLHALAEISPGALLCIH